MSVRDVLRAVLHGEVDSIDRGTHHLSEMRDRISEREAERDRLRQHASQVHPEVSAAVKRRLRVM